MPKSPQLSELIARYSIASEDADALARLLEPHAETRAETRVVDASPASTDDTVTLAAPRDYAPGGTTMFDDGTPSVVEAYPIRGADVPRGAPNVVDLPGLPGRYRAESLLGTGGMGEVWRVHDAELNRRVALKVIRADRTGDTSMVMRFVREAQVCAQLQHPGVVGVHELGRLSDGRWFFTMREIRGETLSQVLETHERQRGTADATWTLPRLVEVFRRVCETVGYAHERGVVHRDLKPANIMVGPFGDVLVLDWGIAKLVAAPDGADADAAVRQPPVAMGGGLDESVSTQVGWIVGTPMYMSPEQASGRPERVGPPSDVFSLGAILFELLAGHPPFERGAPQEIVLRVLGAERRAWPERAAPEALRGICDRAMRVAEPHYPNAGALARDIGDWLEGALARQKALEIVVGAARFPAEVAALEARADSCRARAEELGEAVAAVDPIDRKRPIWELEDEAAVLDRDARLRELEYVQALRSALNLVPDLPEAHRGLADYYRARHERAESRRDEVEAAIAEILVRAHDRERRHAAYLDGQGEVTLRTRPAGAAVRVHRFESRDRRLVPRLDRVIATTPVVEERLPFGTWFCSVEAPGFAPAPVPLVVPRGGRNASNGPDGAPFEIPLLPSGTLGPDDCYVPAGWARVGGDPIAPNSLPERWVWVDGFVMRRDPVTNAEFIAFLDDLVAAGREHDALAHVPRERTGAAAGDDGAMVYGRDEAGRFCLQPDADGDLWGPDWPVCMITWDAARAYAEWEAARSGIPWRLPLSLEWEKAARGPDGRVFPWGDFLDPTWACMGESHIGRRMPAPVDRFATDVSPYGVRGLAGNVCDWCWDGEDDAESNDTVALPVGTPWPAASGDRCVRGGAWLNAEPYCRAARRHITPHSSRLAFVGFRLARSLTERERGVGR